ncbi:hypothetical protein [Halioxenophilus aromaticivorans]|uniref:TIR domain-containing protein n=1 Tax=Halioxenophilus aromaticivorans TaxID=1306992 RepID=A0AAV3U3N6_9ALTE
MKVFLSYTIRDGLINKNLLQLLDGEISRECDIYIDLLHNRSATPQDEVIKQLVSSDMLIQITTPSIDDSGWASLEANLAAEQKIKTCFVEYFHSNPNQLIIDLVQIIKSSNATRQNALICSSA